MPLDPLIASRLHVFDGLGDEDRFPSPKLLAAFQAFSSGDRPVDIPDVDTSEQLVAGPHGDIRVRIYRPSRQSGIGLVWLHGGGFVGGDLDMCEADHVARHLCDRVGATVVSVDYRLAIEDGLRFPVPHDDVVAAWLWVASATRELGIDPRRLALGGCSAGANLATGAALRLRDNGWPAPHRLLLAYPLLHFSAPPLEAEPADMNLVPSILRFTPDTIAAINTNYMGVGVEPCPYAFPSLGELAGLPPTLILTSEYDLLRASGEDFARRLLAAGVPVNLVCEHGVMHGHLNNRQLDAWERSVGVLARVLNNTSESSPGPVAAF